MENNRQTRRELVAFDFDGTLTSADSLFALLRFAGGKWRMTAEMAMLLPHFILILLGLSNGGRAKQRILRRYFGGWKEDDFNSFCRRFASAHAHIMREDMVEILRQAQRDGKEVVVVSASVSNWIREFLPGVRIISTEMETKDGRLTGRFSTPNCIGPEKTRRLLEAFPDLRHAYRLTAYGDSPGDREMLAMAQEAHKVEKKA